MGKIKTVLPILLLSVVFLAGCFPNAKSGNDKKAIVDLAVQFDGSKSSAVNGDPLSYQWDLGDGSAIKNGAKVNHTFQSTGTYTVTLTLTDKQGFKDTDTLTVEVMELDAGEDVQGSIGELLEFEGTARTEISGQTLTWQWDFGDNSAPEAGPIVNHTYHSPEIYTVTLYVTDTENNTAADTFLVDVSAGINDPPQAVIDSITPNPANYDDGITFTGHGEDSDGVILSYQWESNIDGIIGEDVTITAVLAAGSHNISFKVMDDDDAWSEAVIETVVVQTPGISPFAVEIVDYSPAPGQFTYVLPDLSPDPDSRFGNPDRALGPPVGGGIQAPNNTSLVSLGGFGGSIVLKFDHIVMDNPSEVGNPHGFDFIVFGNAFVNISTPGGGRWAEPGIVEISENGSDWYLIPGSSLRENSGPGPVYEKIDKTYEDTGGTVNITFSGFPLPGDLTDGFDEELEDLYIWGYGDINAIMALPEGEDPEIFYTIPDDPYTAGIDENTCGGDAFDIAWAVDPVTGNSANLDGFQYIKITTAIDYEAGVLGEISTEIDAVSDIGIESE